MTGPRKLVLWGWHPAHGAECLKLADYSPAEERRRTAEGWTCAAYAEGDAPEGLRAQVAGLRAAASRWRPTDPNLRKRTDWRIMPDGRRIRAEYGWRNLNGPGRAHFAIGGETEVQYSPGYANGRRYWQEDSCGCLHEDVRANFPELAELIPWHLTAEDGPLHYATNAAYLWDCAADGESGAADGFRRTVIFGALEDDAATYPGDPSPGREVVRALPPRGFSDLPSSDAYAARWGPEHLERRAAVRAWTAARLPRLMEAFWATMERHGLAVRED